MTITELTNAIFNASGLNNAQIANRISLNQTKTVSRQAISNYRNGYQFLRFERLMEIADVLDVEVNFSVSKIETII